MKFTCCDTPETCTHILQAMENEYATGVSFWPRFASLPREVQQKWDAVGHEPAPHRVISKTMRINNGHPFPSTYM